MSGSQLLLTQNRERLIHVILFFCLTLVRINQYCNKSVVANLGVVKLVKFYQVVFPIQLSVVTKATRKQDLIK